MAFGDVFRRATTGARKIGVAAAEKGAEAAKTAWERSREKAEPTAREAKERVGRAWGEAHYRVFERPEETVRAEREFEAGARHELWRELGRATMAKWGVDEQSEFREKSSREFIEAFGEEEFSRIKDSPQWDAYIHEKLGAELWQQFTPEQREYYTRTRARGYHARAEAREEARKMGIPEVGEVREKVWKGPTEGWVVEPYRRKIPESELRLMVEAQKVAEEKLRGAQESARVERLKARHEMVRERLVPFKMTAAGVARTARGVGMASEARLMRPVARPITEVTPTGVRGEVFALQRPRTLITAPPPGSVSPAPHPVAGLESMRQLTAPTIKSSGLFAQELRRIRRGLWR